MATNPKGWWSMQALFQPDKGRQMLNFVTQEGLVTTGGKKLAEARPYK